MLSTYSAASGGSVSAYIGRVCGRGHSANRIQLRGVCSRGIGQASRSIPISDAWMPLGCGRMACRCQTCSAAGSRVRTSASRGGVPAWMGSGRDFGPRWRAWSPSADRAGWWLRTSLGCEAAARTGCSARWRLWATPAGRSWWVLLMPEHPTGGHGFGWWRKPFLPTPVARDWKWGSRAQIGRRRACQLNDAVGGRLHPGFVEWMMGFPEGWTGAGGCRR